MTFCLGMKVQQGLIALADTRIVKGSERLSKGKVSLLEHDGQTFFIMTSGLRSVRDKAVIYLTEHLANLSTPYDRFYQIANAFGEQLRRVFIEDGPSLAISKLEFNLHTIIGGQLANDAGPEMFYIYPEGNWIEASPDSPYFIIGRTTYGRPILDRFLTRDTSLQTSVTLGYLAFDATRTSVTDVDYPFDILILENGNRHFKQHRFDARNMHDTQEWWQQRLRAALQDIPHDWSNVLFEKNPL
ncbi:MAG: proteasome-type protease [Pseudomonadota bacterium]